MTRTCAQCSAYHGKLWCDRFRQKTLPGAPICSNPRNGWDIEWKASGFSWDKFDEDYDENRVPREHDKWFLRTDLGIIEGYLEWCACKSDLLLWSAWDGRTELEIAIGTLEHCARALIARVKGDTGG